MSFRQFGGKNEFQKNQIIRAKNINSDTMGTGHITLIGKNGNWLNYNDQSNNFPNSNLGIRKEYIRFSNTDVSFNSTNNIYGNDGARIYSDTLGKDKSQFVLEIQDNIAPTGNLYDKFIIRARDYNYYIDASSQYIKELAIFKANGDFCANNICSIEGTLVADLSNNNMDFRTIPTLNGVPIDISGSASHLITSVDTTNILTAENKKLTLKQTDVSNSSFEMFTNDDDSFLILSEKLPSGNTNLLFRHIDYSSNPSGDATNLMTLFKSGYANFTNIVDIGTTGTLFLRYNDLDISAQTTMLTNDPSRNVSDPSGRTLGWFGGQMEIINGDQGFTGTGFQGNEGKFSLNLVDNNDSKDFVSLMFTDNSGSNTKGQGAIVLEPSGSSYAMNFYVKSGGSLSGDTPVFGIENDKKMNIYSDVHIYNNVDISGAITTTESFILQDSSGTPVNGALRFNSGDVEVYSGGVWNHIGTSSNPTSNWSKNGNNLFYNGGNVGIGTNNPTSTMDVNGNIHVSETSQFDGIVTIDNSLNVNNINIGNVITSNFNNPNSDKQLLFQNNGTDFRISVAEENKNVSYFGTTSQHPCALVSYNKDKIIFNENVTEMLQDVDMCNNSISNVKLGGQNDAVPRSYIDGYVTQINQDISNNAANISNNVANISNNAANISNNAANISNNEASIIKNSQDISNNAANISNNEEAITNLQNNKFDISGGLIDGNVQISNSLDVSGTITTSNSLVLQESSGTNVDGALRFNSGDVEVYSGGIWNHIGNSSNPTSNWSKNGNNLFYSGGNVGIGINNPNSALDVSGNIIVHGESEFNNNVVIKNSDQNITLGGGNGYSLVSINNETTNTFGFGNSDDTGKIFQMQFNYDDASQNNTMDFQFRGQGIMTMAYQNSGRVGIGTSSPSQKLDVNGNISLNGNIIGQQQNNDFIIGNTSNHSVRIQQDNSDNIVMDGSYVTLNPVTIIKGGGTNGIRITDNFQSPLGNGQNEFEFLTGRPFYHFKTGSSTSNNSVLRFSTGGLELFGGAIKNSGKIGIGIDEPSNELDVSGNINANKYLIENIDLSHGIINEVNQIISFGINTSQFGNVNNSRSGFITRMDTRPGVDKFAIITKDINDSNTSGTEKFIIDSSGYVGIGTFTSKPSNKLHVSGQDSIARFDRGVISSFTSQWITNNTEYNIINDTLNVGMYGYKNTSNNIIDLLFKTRTNSENATEIMRITHQGFVGIGTSTPAEKLDVNGNVNVRETLIVGNGVPFTIQDLGASNPNAFALSSNRPNILFRNQTTNILQLNVGTSEFFSNLDVQGQLSCNSPLSIDNANGAYISLNKINNNVGRSGYIGYPSGNNSTLQIVNQQTDANGHITFNTKSEERMRIELNGNVGIGTSSPSELFQVNSGNNPILQVGDNGVIIHRRTNTTSNTIAGGVTTFGPNFSLIDSSGGINDLYFPTNFASGTVFENIYTSLINTDNGKSATNPFHPSLTVDGLIYSTGGIIFQSDIRTKKNISPIDHYQALKNIRDIECYKYNYIDEHHRASRDNVLGFIAQDVKEKIPEAVKTKKEIIPSEYKPLQSYDYIWDEISEESIDTSGNTIITTKYKLTIDGLDLSGNEYNGNVKFKFYVSDADFSNIDLSNIDLSNTEVLQEIYKQIVDNKETELEIYSISGEPMSFIFDKKWNFIFVYGKEVHDFHTLNKDYIFTTHHAAIQEIDKKQLKDEEDIQTMKTQISNLQQENQELKTKVSLLEDNYSHLLNILNDLQNRLTIIENA
jgi:hypothetical protein